jgi:hypothetical protein
MHRPPGSLKAADAMVREKESNNVFFLFFFKKHRILTIFFSQVMATHPCLIKIALDPKAFLVQLIFFDSLETRIQINVLQICVISVTVIKRAINGLQEDLSFLFFFPVLLFLNSRLLLEKNYSRVLLFTFAQFQYFQIS